MIRSFILNNYLGKEFLKIVFNTSLIFFCMGFIINIFEEVNYFKDYNVGIKLPIIMSMLFVPLLIICPVVTHRCQVILLPHTME